MNNAYDLRYTDYRYIRGKSKLIDKCEELFKDSILTPNGMSAISLVLQYYKPKTIWYPEELYRETQNLIRFLGIKYTEDSPEMVLIDYPSFRGLKHSNPFPNSLLVIDNSLDPSEQPECDVLITSLSKHFVNCETVLGLIKLNTHKQDLNNLKLLRCASGYAIFDFQCEALLKNIPNYENLLTVTKDKAVVLGDLFKSGGYECIVSGSVVFVLVNSSPRDIALKTPFELRPTYGCDRTFCSYSFYEGDLTYFNSKYLRISVGLDYSAEDIYKIVSNAINC